MLSEPIKKTISIAQTYGVKSILEVGCGKGGILEQFPIEKKVGIDHFAPYIIEANNKYPEILFIKHDLKRLYELLPIPAFDMIIGFDILEHLEEQDMINLVVTCEELSKKVIVFFSPLGIEGLKAFTEDVDMNSRMKHITIIEEEFFKNRGYATTIYKNYHKQNIDAVLAIKEL
jgi:2-polyprenyl-3-methyl-5-hydroxy-6-metoxy-1,4-benzoquinol methylase